MTKERLRAYRKLCREERQISRRIQSMEAALYAPRVQHLTGMPSGGAVGRGVEDLAERHMELLDHYRALLSNVEREQLAIEQAIGSLDTTQRQVLRLHYIDGLTWEQVAAKTNYSLRQIHNIHGDALLKLRD